MIKLFKRKPKLIKVMVYKKITECSKFYIVHNLKTREKEIIKNLKLGGINDYDKGFRTIRKLI